MRRVADRTSCLVTWFAGNKRGALTSRCRSRILTAKSDRAPSGVFPRVVWKDKDLKKMILILLAACTTTPASQLDEVSSAVSDEPPGVCPKDKMWHACSHATTDNCPFTCSDSAFCGDCRWEPGPVFGKHGKWVGVNGFASECPQAPEPEIGQSWVRPFCMVFGAEVDGPDSTHQSFDNI